MSGYHPTIPDCTKKGNVRFSSSQKPSLSLAQTHAVPALPANDEPNLPRPPDSTRSITSTTQPSRSLASPPKSSSLHPISLSNSTPPPKRTSSTLLWTSRPRSCLLSVQHPFLHLMAFHYYMLRTTSAAPNPYDHACATHHPLAPMILLLPPFLIHHLLGSPSSPSHRLSNQPGSCFLLPPSGFRLPLLVLWPSPPPLRGPPLQISRIHFAARTWIRYARFVCS